MQFSKHSYLLTGKNMHVSSPVRIRKVENGGKYGREGRYDEAEADNTGNIEGFMGGKEADMWKLAIYPPLRCAD